MTTSDNLLVRLASAIAGAPSSETLSGRLCLAVRGLTGADEVSITVSYDPDNRVTVSSTGDLAARVEDLQDVLREGPSVSALATGKPCVSTVHEESGSWPAFRAAAAGLAPLVAVHALPMQVDDRVIGVLALCRTAPERPLALDRATLLRLAAATGAALVRDPTALDVAINDGPWDSRALVHQATGMVMAQLGIPAVDATALLRAHAYAGDLTMDTVARHVLDRSLRFQA